jgi:predicted metal-dependent peptidase
MTKETAEERMIRTKIQIAYSNPFFAYLSLYLTIEEDKANKIPKNYGMGINPSGRILYREKFVNGLTDAQLIGSVLHEQLHLTLLHFARGNKKNNVKFNLASDLVINTILTNNGYELPIGALKPVKNRFIVFGKIIDNIDKKSAEEVYDELPDIPEEKSSTFSGFDNHEKGKAEDGEPTKSELTEPELQELETQWLNRVETALVYAQQKGVLPLGIERHINKLKNAEINWKVILRRFIQQSVPVDYSWSRPSKKSVACGCYLPSTLKEKINIVVTIDGSGSVEKPELTKFVSEIVGIAKSFKDVVDMRIMFHDTEVLTDYVIKNGNVSEIMAMKPKGGGGTSHKCVFNKIKKDIRNCRCLISFTDGESDIENINFKKYTFAKLFIITKNGVIPKIDKHIATFIKLRGDD